MQNDENNGAGGPGAGTGSLGMARGPLSSMIPKTKRLMHMSQKDYLSLGETLI
jgi:hypothetical protein